MNDPMIAILQGEIGRLVMENAALKGKVQAAEAELKELRVRDVPMAPGLGPDGDWLKDGVWLKAAE